MYRFTWIYNTPSIREYHDQAGSIMFHTHEVAQEFYNRAHNDPRYTGLTCEYYNSGWFDCRATLEHMRRKKG